MSDLGRQVKYGIGKEATPGTAVAATKWVNQLKFELNPVSNYAVNDAAWGNIAKTNSADITQKSAKGTLNAKLTPETSGLILLGAFGSVSNATNSDVSGTVYDHTYTLNQTVEGQTFTLVRKDSVSTEAFALARFDKWELNVSLDDYVQFNADVMSKTGASTTASPAYVAETEFVAKHVTVKTASTSSGLSGATAIATVSSFTLHLDPNLKDDYAFGSYDPYSFSSQGYDLSFEMECRYVDSTFHDAYINGTNLALQLAIQNTDVTIGTAAHPGLVVTAYKANITDWARNEDLDGPVTQKLTGTIHYSASDAKAIQAILTNITATY